MKYKTSESTYFDSEKVFNLCIECCSNKLFIAFVNNDTPHVFFKWGIYIVSSNSINDFKVICETCKKIKTINNVLEIFNIKLLGGRKAVDLYLESHNND